MTAFQYKSEKIYDSKTTKLECSVPASAKIKIRGTAKSPNRENMSAEISCFTVHPCSHHYKSKFSWHINVFASYLVSWTVENYLTLIKTVISRVVTKLLYCFYYRMFHGIYLFNLWIHICYSYSTLTVFCNAIKTF